MSKKEVVWLGTKPALCDLCKDEGLRVRADYDFKTRYGPWALGCSTHFEIHGIQLGTGFGQKLIWTDEDNANAVRVYFDSVGYGSTAVGVLPSSPSFAGQYVSSAWFSDIPEEVEVVGKTARELMDAGAVLLY